MIGTGDGAFSPDEELTRAQTVTLLSRLSADETPTDGDPGFSDVARTEYYSRAVVWAAESGIAEGFGDGAFLPDEPVTRQEFAAFTVRFLTHENLFLPEEQTAPFTDGIAEWSADDVETLHRAGLFFGDGKGAFRPGDPVTRAEAAAALDSAVRPLETGEAGALGRAAEEILYEIAVRRSLSGGGGAA